MRACMAVPLSWVAYVPHVFLMLSSCSPHAVHPIAFQRAISATIYPGLWPESERSFELLDSQGACRESPNLEKRVFVI
ncbi:hypothetical protein F5Y17DRAFT_437387 [Xylariaceae sp. FL0594]|nr:hypothetical protein F5Y17DRAFT_437387 [Xylariaceae sp. FL0594]